MVAAFELETTPTNTFHFVLRAPNGEIILTSETYGSKADALNGIASVRASSTMDDNFRRRVSQSGQAYFVLVAPSGETIGTSGMYSTTAARDKGVHAVKLHAPAANIDDKA